MAKFSALMNKRNKKYFPYLGSKNLLIRPDGGKFPLDSSVFDLDSECEVDELEFTEDQRRVYRATYSEKSDGMFIFDLNRIQEDISKEAGWQQRHSLLLDVAYLQRKEGTVAEFSILDDTRENSGGSEDVGPQIEDLQAAVVEIPGPNGPIELGDIVGVNEACGTILVNFNFEQSNPQKFYRFRIRPKNFLKNVSEVLAQELWKIAIRSNVDFFSKPRDRGNHGAVEISSNSPLNLSQKEACTWALKRGVSFIQGPPGTGKSFLLKEIIVEALAENLNRILVVGPTNRVVDELIFKVSEEASIKWECIQRLVDPKRANFELFIDRLQLLGLQQKDHRSLISDFRSLGRKERQEIANSMASTQLAKLTRPRIVAGLTAHRLASLMNRRLLAPNSFDLVIVDEASQLSYALSTLVLPHAERIVFAGDPYQLGPVSQAPDCQNLSNSSFALSQTFCPDRKPFFLNEQKRMHPQICDAISGVFYEGRISTCQKSELSRLWRAYRRPIVFSNYSGNSLRRVESNIQIVNICSDSEFDSRGKRRRIESAEKIAGLLKGDLSGMPPEEVLILSPFRSQVRHIQEQIPRAYCNRVFTVHKAQGKEARVVIFDVVNGSSKFISRELVNVALSRAQGVLVLLLSERDFENRWLNHFCEQVNAQELKRSVAY